MSITRLLDAVLPTANDDWALLHRYGEVEEMIELDARLPEHAFTPQITPAA